MERPLFYNSVVEGIFSARAFLLFEMFLFFSDGYPVSGFQNSSLRLLINRYDY